MRKITAMLAMMALGAGAIEDDFVPVETPPEPIDPRRQALLDGMLDLARRPPPGPPPPRTALDGARGCMMSIYAALVTGGLTRYAFPRPRFDLVDGAYVDRTYAPDEVANPRYKETT